MENVDIEQETTPFTHNPTMTDVASSGSNGSGNIARLRNYSATGYKLLSSREWRNTLRGPSTFFGVGESVREDLQGWNVPKGMEIGPRLTKNLNFFATNYAGFSTALMTYEILQDWSIMLWLLGVFGIWTFVLRAAAAGQLFPLVVQGVTIEKNKLYLGMSVATSIILIVYVGSTFLFVTGCTFLFALLHSTFRNPLSYKTHDSVEEAANPFTHSMEEGGVEMTGGDNI